MKWTGYFKKQKHASLFVWKVDIAFSAAAWFSSSHAEGSLIILYKWGITEAQVSANWAKMICNENLTKRKFYVKLQFTSEFFTIV